MHLEVHKQFKGDISSNVTSPMIFFVTYFFLSFSFFATCARIWPYNFSELWPCVGPLIGAQETAELIFLGKQWGEVWWAEEGSLQEVTSLWLLYTRLSWPSSPLTLHSECVLCIVSLLYPLCVCVCVKESVWTIFKDIYHQHLACVVCMCWISVACSQRKCV